jgi:hypothetical protein
MARTKSTRREDGTTRTYTRRSPAERAQLELDKAQRPRREGAEARREGAGRAPTQRRRNCRAPSASSEYAASSPDLPEQEAPTQSDRGSASPSD